MGCQPTPLLVLLAAAGWATSSKRWWPLVLHSTCRRVRDFSSRADVHVWFDLNPCWIAAAQLRGQVSARHTKGCVSLPWLEISGPFAGRILPSVSPRADLCCRRMTGRQLRGAKEFQMSDSQAHDMVL
ncbi:hypothetical protein Trisim1_012470 [Trichoderma cf. simile WF8]